MAAVTTNTATATWAHSAHLTASTRSMPRKLTRAADARAYVDAEQATTRPHSVPARRGGREAAPSSPFTRGLRSRCREHLVDGDLVPVDAGDRLAQGLGGLAAQLTRALLARAK